MKFLRISELKSILLRTERIACRSAECEVFVDCLTALICDLLGRLSQLSSEQNRILDGFVPTFQTGFLGLGSYHNSTSSTFIFCGRSSAVSKPFFCQPLSQDLSVTAVQRAFQECPYQLVLDSAAGRGDFDARYSFATAAPVDVCRIDSVKFGDQPFQQVRELQTRLPAVNEECPPFCGGLAGLLSYEIGCAFERVPTPEANPFETPALLVALYDWAIVWDHLLQTVSLWILEIEPVDAVSNNCHSISHRLAWVENKLAGIGAADNSQGNVPVAEWASVFEPQAYMAAVQDVIDYISAGDIFQANLSQQLTGDWSGSSGELFERVRAFNPAPFCGMLTAPDFSVVSASPERFLKVDSSGKVETRPIKGTRRRQLSPVADLLVGEALKTSLKDRAENVMIVDLLRNDISRVCETGSVKVTGVCELEVFETVQHLVSTVVGQLKAECDVWDLCAATLPGGSITGAPKIRAMEIIAELEPVVRGAYCGNLFYCGPNGDFDSSILIRTFTLKNGRVQFPVGGGVVSDSEPVDEYEETLHKASGMLRVLNAVPGDGQGLANR